MVSASRVLARGATGVSEVRAHGVAVRADELAVGDLFEHTLSTPAPREDRDVRSLGPSRKVIPVHSHRMKDVTAVGAGTSGLEPRVPLQELIVTTAVLHASLFVVRSVVRRRVVALAGLAPRLVAVFGAVEVTQRLLDIARPQRLLLLRDSSLLFPERMFPYVPDARFAAPGAMLASRRLARCQGPLAVLPAR